jgi:hypothetical protein
MNSIACENLLESVYLTVSSCHQALCCFAQIPCIDDIGENTHVALKSSEECENSVLVIHHDIRQQVHPDANEGSVESC